MFPRTVAWHDDQAVDAFVDKHLDQVVQFSGVLIRAAENNRIFILVGFVFDATGDIGKKGVGNIGENHPDSIGASLTQAAGRIIGLIVEFFGDRKYFFRRFGADAILSARHIVHDE